MCEEILKDVKVTLYRLLEFYVASLSTFPTTQYSNHVQPSGEANSSCGHGQDKDLMGDYKRRKVASGCHKTWWKH